MEALAAWWSAGDYNDPESPSVAFLASPSLLSTSSSWVDNHIARTKLINMLIGVWVYCDSDYGGTLSASRKTVTACDKSNTDGNGTRSAEIRPRRSEGRRSRGASTISGTSVHGGSNEGSECREH